MDNETNFQVAIVFGKSFLQNCGKNLNIDKNLKSCQYLFLLCISYSFYRIVCLFGPCQDVSSRHSIVWRGILQILNWIFKKTFGGSGKPPPFGGIMKALFWFQLPVLWFSFINY